jgi:hypothetical protein
MSIGPPDPVADAHLTADDFQNFAFARRGADLRRVDDDEIARPAWRGQRGCAT